MTKVIAILMFIKEVINDEDKMTKFKEIIYEVKELIYDIKDVVNLFKKDDEQAI